MRNIIFEFDQTHAIKLGLKIDELLLLSYFYNFFQDGRAKWIMRGGERFFLIRYAKILSDLPILGTSTKTIQRTVSELERKGALKRYLKGNRELYLWIHWLRLFDREEAAETATQNTGLDPPTQSCPAIFNIEGQDTERQAFEKDNPDQLHIPKCPAIDSYLYKIKIIITNPCAGAREIDKDLLLREVRKRLEISCSGLLLDTFFVRVRISDITDSFVEFTFPTEIAAGAFKKEFALLKLESATIAAVKVFTDTE